MRLVFVNHAHPDIAHVSGMRMGYYAKEMALRGHQVVLLTCALPGAPGENVTAADVRTRLSGHDWKVPLVIAVPPIRRRVLELIRQNRLPNVLRRSFTLGQFLVHGGTFADWQKAAASAVVQLSEKFRPQLVWGTFGNTTNLAIAQQLARRAGCPWIADIKDSWAAFIPGALRRLMAWRFRDVWGFTSNSLHHQQVAMRWFSRRPTEVVYSGVADEFFERRKARRAPEKRHLLLVGGVYDDVRLRTYLAEVAGWMNQLPATERADVRFIYSGSDGARVAAALEEIPLPCPVDLPAYRSIRELAELAAQSFANTYLFAAFTFHHKLLELLVSGRPLICFPGEHDESKALAARTDTVFAVCATGPELRKALATAWLARDTDVQPSSLPPWRWADFAKRLDEYFQRCAMEGRV